MGPGPGLGGYSMASSDGYWDNDNQTVYLCTEGFSYPKSEAQRGVIGPWAQALTWGVIPWPLVLHLISLLSRLHGLKATTKPRGNSYRIRFSSPKGRSMGPGPGLGSMASSAGNNLKHLSQLVLPYMHPSMLYKLNVKS